MERVENGEKGEENRRVRRARDEGCSVRQSWRVLAQHLKADVNVSLNIATDSSSSSQVLLYEPTDTRWNRRVKTNSRLETRDSKLNDHWI